MRVGCFVSAANSGSLLGVRDRAIRGPSTGRAATSCAGAAVGAVLGNDTFLGGVGAGVSTRAGIAMGIVGPADAGAKVTLRPYSVRTELPMPTGAVAACRKEGAEGIEDMRTEPDDVAPAPMPGGGVADPAGRTDMRTDPAPATVSLTIVGTEGTAKGFVAVAADGAAALLGEVPKTTALRGGVTDCLGATRPGTADGTRPVISTGSRAGTAEVCGNEPLLGTNSVSHRIRFEGLFNKPWPLAWTSSGGMPAMLEG